MNISTFPILQKQSRYFPSIVLLFLFFTVVSATNPLPEEIQSNAKQVIDLVCKEEFKSAEETAKRIVKKYPENPAGYFFVATALESWMSYYEDNKKEDEFYRYCDLVIEKGEKILNKDSTDEWAMFFIGGAEGYKGTYEAHYERWITAFRYGWRGVSWFVKLSEMKSEIVDINYGIGSYDYWRSALMKTLWWMPGVKDKREEGIKKLYLALEKGTYTRVAASAALIEILINENRIEEALPIAEKMVMLYPTSTMFLWGKGRILFGLGHLDEAQKIFSFLLKRYESDNIDNHFNSILCHYWLARIAFVQENYKNSLEQVTAMEAYQCSDNIKKLLDKYFSESHSMRRKINSVLEKK